MLLPKIIHILTTITFVSGIWTCEDNIISPDDTSCHDEIIKACECWKGYYSPCCTNLVDGVLNVFYRIQERCGKNDVKVKQVKQVLIVQGGEDYCYPEVKWMYHGIYNRKTQVQLPFGTNFSHPGVSHLNLTGYYEEFEGGPPYIPLEKVTSTFLNRFRKDKRLEVSRGRTLDEVMNIYNGNRNNTSLPLKYKNGTSLPKQGFLFQQVGICNHKALPDKFQFIVYTDNLRAIPFPIMDGGVPTDKFVEYDNYRNRDRLEKTYTRTKVRRGLSIENSPRELVIPKTAMNKAGDMVAQLQSKFRQIGKSKVTGIDWSDIELDNWDMEHFIESPWNVSVPADSVVVFYTVQGHLNDWIFTLDLDRYEIIRGGCSIEAVGFPLGLGPTKKC